MANTNPPNKAIGTIKCPICKQPAEVRAMKASATERKNRWAGKRYIVCATDGAIGMDNKPAIRNYIELNAKIFEVPAAPPAPPAPTPENQPPAPTPPMPEHIDGPPKKKGIGFFAD